MNPTVGGPRAAFPGRMHTGRPHMLCRRMDMRGTRMAGDSPPRPWCRSRRSSILSRRAASAPLRQPGARPPRGPSVPPRPADRLRSEGPVEGEQRNVGGRGRHRGARGRGLPARPPRKGRMTRRPFTRRRGRPTRGRDARAGRFWPGEDPGEGQSYTGLFPRPIGKRFSRARRSAPWGPVRAPVGRGEGRGRSGTPGRDHAETRIFIRHHNMWGRLPCFSPRGEDVRGGFGSSASKIPYTNFGEFTFHALR